MKKHSVMKSKQIDCAIPVVMVPKGKSTKAVDPWELPSNAPLGLKGTFTFTYNYPLSREVRIERKLPRETSALDLLRFGREDYERIYREEDEDVGSKTGNVPGMLNRARSDGRHGIWGHSINDLIFECILMDTSKREISFGVGS